MTVVAVTTATSAAAAQSIAARGERRNMGTPGQERGTLSGKGEAWGASRVRCRGSSPAPKSYADFLVLDFFGSDFLVPESDFDELPESDDLESDDLESDDLESDDFDSEPLPEAELGRTPSP